MVPTVPDRMILNDELRGDRRAETQREWGCTIQFFIGELSHRVGVLPAVPAQDFNRGSFGHLGISQGMFSVQLGDSFPGDIRNGLTAGDGPREINLDRLDTANMMHDDSNWTTVRSRHRCPPLRFRESFSEDSQLGSAFLDAIRQ